MTKKRIVRVRDWRLNPKKIIFNSVEPFKIAFNDP